jgi:RHS repeat-associated protein
MPNENCAPVVHLGANPVNTSRMHLTFCLLFTASLSWALGPRAADVRGQSVDNLRSIGIPELSAQLPVEMGYINAGNGNLHLEIPLGTFAHRSGKQIRLAFTYDSSIWNSTWAGCCAWTPFNVPPTGVKGTDQFEGWRLFISSDIGKLDYNARTGRYCRAGGVDEYDYFEGWNWTDPGGTTHAFHMHTVGGYNTGPPPSGCGDYSNQTQPNADALAMDGSGYHMYVTGITNATVYAPDGTVVYSAWPSYTGTRDSNGNFTGYSTQGYSAVDNLGRSLISRTANGNTLTYSVMNGTGGTSTYIVTKEDINVSTNFGSNTGTEYPSGTMPPTITVIQSIQLPDGTKYIFGYDSGTTPGHYGQLTSMTLPTGGTVYYSYVNFLDAAYDINIIGPHMLRGISSRTTPDGTWTYTPLVTLQCTQQMQNGCQQQLSVTKPMYNGRSDNAVYKFNLNGGPWPIEVDYYNGAVAPGNLLATLTQSYGYGSRCGLHDACTSGQATVGIKLSSTTTLPITGQASLNQTTQFCSDSYYGNLLYKWEWNFYTGAFVHDPNPSFSSPPACALYTGVAPPDRTTTLSYLNGASYINVNILNRVTSVIVTNGTGSIVSQTVNSYDDWALEPGGTGVVNHDDTNYGSSNTVRGNLTQAKRWLNTTGIWLITKNYYDIVGNLLQKSDPNSNSTYFDYTDNYSGVSPSPRTAGYVTKITKPVTNGINHIERVQYYFGGESAAKCSENFPNASTCATGLSSPRPDYISYTYDNLNRPLTISMGDGGQTSWSYGTSPTSATSTTTIDASHNLVRKTILDGLGRTSQIQSSGGQGTIYTDTIYDAVGRLHSVSNPHFSTSSPTDGVTTYSSYDGLDRVTLVTEQDNSTVSTAYAGNCKTVTDEGLKARKSCYDGFGRLTGVWEDPGSSPHLNYETDYQYDLLDNLTSVTQSGSRQRTFTYDSLSRLLCAANPEVQIVTCPNPDTGSYTPGTIRYAYDANGNVAAKTAPKPNQTSASVTVMTTYQYDPLNRLTQKSYNDGSTSTVQYGFDAIAPANCSPSLTMNYPIGRRTAMCDAPGSEAWSYDVMGRPASDRRTTNGVTTTTTYATPTVPYNFDGSIAQLTYPSGRTITYTPNNAAQPFSAIDTANSIYYAPMARYAPQGALTSMMNGTNILSTMFYNPRLQPCRFAVNATGTAPGSCADTTNKGDVMDYSYDFHLGASDNGNVFKVSNNRTNASDRNINYGYDSLNRIAAAYTDGNLWGETYTIDAWANLTGIGPYSGKPSGETLSEGVNGSNQLTNACSANCYDSAGNLLNDGLNSYTYDPEGHTVTGAGVTYYYDGDGKRVLKSSGTRYWYGMGSDPLDESDAIGNVTEYVFFDGKRIARRDPSGNIFYYFADHLGTSRAILQAGQTAPCYDQDFYPYGREVPHGSEIPAFVNTCPQNYKFTGKERDSESGLDNFGARYDSSQYGRFMTPDPLGGHLEDPQTLNRYAYVRNNPLSLTDPTGLDFYLQCTQNDDNKQTCNQVQMGKQTVTVQGTTNDKGKFDPTVVTSASLQDPKSGNTATVNQNGVQITTQNGTSEGVFITGTPAANNVQGSGVFQGFSFNINGNCTQTCLASGDWSYNGAPNANAARALLYDRGSFTLGIPGLEGILPDEDAVAGFGLGAHPFSTQHRFGGPTDSPHLSVPYDPKGTVPAAGGFHVDAHSNYLGHAEDVFGK